MEGSTRIVIKGHNIALDAGETILVSSRQGDHKTQAKRFSHDSTEMIFILFHFAGTVANELPHAPLDAVSKLLDWKVFTMKLSPAI